MSRASALKRKRRVLIVEGVSGFARGRLVQRGVKRSTRNGAAEHLYGQVIGMVAVRPQSQAEKGSGRDAHGVSVRFVFLLLFLQEFMNL